MKQDTSKSTAFLARLHLIGGLIMLLAVCMIPSLIYSLLDQHNPDQLSFLVCIIGGILMGGGLFWMTRDSIKEVEFDQRDGFLIVTLSWVVAVLFGAFPYYLYAHLSPTGPCLTSEILVGADFCTFTNSFFESMSGFTTTGATIINQGLWDTYEGGVGKMMNGELGLPRGIMLWRCVTHLLGGMGIIVLSVAILPLLGVGGMQLFKAEAPGPQTDKLAPRMGQTARILWKVYAGFTLCLLLTFWLSRSMDFFEALCHSMSTMATGGFSTRSSSVADFNSPFVEWMIIIFMFLASMNFNLHYLSLRKKGYGTSLHNLEFKVYSIIILCSSVIVTVAIMSAGYFKDFFDAVRVAMFQVLSIVTTTGYASTNFELWVGAPSALMILVILMFIGGCAGSTAGGIKVVRHILLVKLWLREFFFLSHPTGKKSIRIDRQVVSPEIIRAALAFIGLYLTLLTFGTLFYTWDGHDLSTAFTCSASSIGNIGPGLGDIGPYDNYAVLSPMGKWISSFLMMLGRLEIYTVLIVLSPSFSRK